MPMKIRARNHHGAGEAFAEALATEEMMPKAKQGNALTEDNIKRLQRNQEQAMVLARAVAEVGSRTKAPEVKPLPAGPKAAEQEKGSSKETTTTYTISYYNPELKKAEVIEAKSEIMVSDYPAQAIEDSLGQRSLLPIYLYMGTPLMKSEVLPWKLEEILGEREYGTPPKSGPGASVVPVLVIEKTATDLAREKVISNAIGETILRKEKTEKELASAIIVLEQAVAELRKGSQMGTAIQRLPPLSRARYLAVLRKKMLERQSLINMLLRDSSFLKGVAKKLGAFSLDDMVNMAKMLRGLKKR
jgi:hypothetical protein